MMVDNHIYAWVRRDRGVPSFGARLVRHGDRDMMGMS